MLKNISINSEILDHLKNLRSRVVLALMEDFLLSELGGASQIDGVRSRLSSLIVLQYALFLSYS
jgi:hypothetical protein